MLGPSPRRDPARRSRPITPLRASRRRSPYGIVADINTTGGSNPTFLTPVPGNVFFAADDGVHGRELWSTDGTTAHLVKNIRPVPAARLRRAWSTSPARSTSPRTTACTAASSGRVTAARPGPGSSGHRTTGGSRPTDLTAAGGKVYFAAYDGVHGNELWVSDGTAAGTHLVKDIASASGHGVISRPADQRERHPLLRRNE